MKKLKPSMLQELRYNKKIASPYMKVEYMHGKQHETVEFDGDGQVHGCEWEDGPKAPKPFMWMLLLAGYFGLIAAILFWGTK